MKLRLINDGKELLRLVGVDAEQVQDLEAQIVNGDPAKLTFNGRTYILGAELLQASIVEIEE